MKGVLERNFRPRNIRALRTDDIVSAIERFLDETTAANDVDELVELTAAVSMKNNKEENHCRDT